VNVIDVPPRDYEFATDGLRGAREVREQAWTYFGYHLGCRSRVENTTWYRRMASVSDTRPLCRPSGAHCKR
jgi:hypothetical protein